MYVHSSHSVLLHHDGLQDLHDVGLIIDPRRPLNDQLGEEEDEPNPEEDHVEVEQHLDVLQPHLSDKGLHRKLQGLLDPGLQLLDLILPIGLKGKNIREVVLGSLGIKLLYYLVLFTK